MSITNARGMSAVEVVVLMSLAALLAISVATALGPRLDAAMATAIECAVNDECQ